MKVKVIASLGPASRDPDVVSKMVSLGVSGFRINFAHGDRSAWVNCIEIVRGSESKVGRYVSLIGDVVGPSLRLGDLKEPINVKRGSIVRFFLYSESRSLEKSRDEVTKVPVDVPKKVFEEISEGDTILMDDGKVSFTVIEVGETFVDAISQTNSMVSSRKAFVVKGKEFDLPTLSVKDVEDLRFACGSGFDYIGLSYVRSSDDIVYARKLLEKLNCNLGLLAKIETLSALKNLDGIIEVSDGVVVARGDLGMNVGLEEIPALQRRVVKKSREYGKPVIVATQILESMIENPVPTRAEVTDIYEAVQSGVDALMVTGETAVGKYPVEVVKWLSKIIKAAEASSEQSRERVAKELRARFVKGVVELAEDLDASIVIYSMKGTTARIASAMRPRVPVYVGVPGVEVARRLAIVWGLNTYVVKASSYVEGLERLYDFLVLRGCIKTDDIVVLSYGLKEEYEQVIKVRRASV